jgi:GWxTD domain-containing protein
MCRRRCLVVFLELCLGSAMLVSGQPPGSAEQWAPGEFSKSRRENFDRVYDRVAGLGSYAKWVMADVGTIITPEELDEFERLGSDAARNIFIERFWARRDAKFKDAHYLRLKTALSRWGVPGNRGFLPDRAFFYMIYGPPDKIETAADHTEAWSYSNFRQPDGATVSLTLKFDAAGEITPPTNPFRKPKQDASAPALPR